jgi:hypothetical protein
MIRRRSHRILAAAAWLGGALLSPAHAQYYYVANAYQQPRLLYPYVQQPQAYYPYAVQPQYAPRAYPYVVPNSGARVLHRQPTTRASRRHVRPVPTHSRVDPALVEELRQRGGAKARAKSPAKLPKIDRTIVVREKPIVVEHQRVVDDPPIIVRREKIVDVPAPEPREARRHSKDQASAESTTPRVIHAEAEVTILGPDRMSIRLFRRGRGLEANAKAKD